MNNNMTAQQFIESINKLYWREDVLVAKDIFLSCVLLNGMSIKDYLENAEVKGDFVKLVIPMRTDEHCVKVTNNVKTRYIGDRSISHIVISNIVHRIFPAEFCNPKKVWYSLSKCVCNDEELINACIGRKSTRIYSQEEKDSLTHKVAEYVGM